VLHSTGQWDGTLIFCFANHGKQALSHGLVESDDADWELYDLHFFFPCEVCLQDTRKGKKQMTFVKFIWYKTCNRFILF
jgi:hypothetical protein